MISRASSLHMQSHVEASSIMEKEGLRMPRRWGAARVATAPQGALFHKTTTAVRDCVKVNRDSLLVYLKMLL